MKNNLEKISISELVNNNFIVRIFIEILLHSYFYTVRQFNKLFTFKDGNIVVISLHRLGATVFTIPAIKEIQKYYNKKITIVCFPDSIPIYDMVLKNINYCVLKRTDFRFGERFAKKVARKKIRSLKPQIIFDLNGAATLIFSVRSEMNVGITKKQYSAVYDYHVEIRNKPKLLDIYLDAISPIIDVSNRAEILNNKTSSITPDGKILIHPFAAWKEKEWNFNKYINLAKKLNKKFSVSLITQPNQISFDILQELDNCNIDIIQTPSSFELIQKIKECSFLIGNDSGPVNIANFIGKPTATIYGSTNPDYTATDFNHQIIIQETLKCSAGKNDKYCIIGSGKMNCSGIQCMNLLTVENVERKIFPLLEKYCSKKMNSALNN